MLAAGTAPGFQRYTAQITILGKIRGFYGDIGHMDTGALTLILPLTGGNQFAVHQDLLYFRFCRLTGFFIRQGIVPPFDAQITVPTGGYGNRGTLTTG